MTLAMRHDQSRAAVPAVPVSPDLSGFEQMWSAAEAVARSGFITGAKTPEAALSLMLVCQAQGRHIGEAITRFHVIKGIPSVKADVQLADFQARGGICKWIETSAKVARAAFSHPKYHPEPLTIEVLMEELVSNGTAMSWDEKSGRMVLRDIYKKSPGAMLRARVVTQGVKAVDPGALHGFNSYEEVLDFADDPDPLRASVSAHSEPSPQQLAQSDAEVLGFPGGGFDDRPYHLVVSEAAAEMNRIVAERLKAAFPDGPAPAVVSANPHEMHRHLRHAAMNLGYTNGEPPKNMAAAIKEMSAVYKEQRAWVRSMIGEHLLGVDEAADEAIAMALQSKAPADDAVTPHPDAEDFDTADA